MTISPAIRAELARLGHPTATDEQVVRSAMAAYNLSRHEALNLLHGPAPKIVGRPPPR